MTEKEDVKTSDEKSDFKSGDDKHKEQKSRKDKLKPLTKVIIRRLPPSMTEQELIKQIEPFPEYDYFYFVPADYSLGENASARAYIDFIDQEDIFLFKDKFDGYVFVDKRGAEYPAVVEFAPFQGFPRNKSRKKNNKCGTIESDQHYINFLATLNADENDINKTEAKMEYSYQIKDDKKITSTPLLEFIASKRQARRDERRKKIEDKKKQREDDKQRKQNQVAKGIPPTISEEKDDGIIVRTIKSRPMDRQKKERLFEPKAKQTDDKSRSFKDDRERDRKKSDERRKVEREKREERQKNRDEFNAKRKEDREKQKRDRADEKERRKSEADDGKVGGGAAASAGVGDKSKEEKGRKYSENRRERLSRNDYKQNASKDMEKFNKKGDTGQAESNSRTADGKSKAGDATENQGKEESSKVEKHVPSDDTKRDSSSGDGDNGMGKDERKRIKNKDRPSLQIYQPGKRRLSTSGQKGESKPNSPTEKNAPSTTSATSQMGEIELLANQDKTVEPTTNLECAEGPKTERKPSVEPKPITEKKVSRYSERRNKARERKFSKNDSAESSNTNAELLKTVDTIGDDLKNIAISDDWNKICSEETT